MTEDEIRGFCAEMGMAEPFTEFTLQFCERTRRAVGEEAEELFVSDSFDPEGGRSLFKLWAFTEHFAMEAPTFGSESFDSVRYVGTVARLEWHPEEYDFAGSSDR